MTDTQSIERLVRVEVIMDEIRGDIKEVVRKFDKVDERLSVVETKIGKAEVGWKVLITVGSFALTAAGAVGALLAKWLPFFSGLPK